MKKEKNLHNSGVKRRDFLKSAGLAASGLAVAPGMTFAREESAAKKVRVGWIGMGGRGIQIMRAALSIPGVEVVAVCDILEERNTLAQNVVVEAGQPRPDAYGRGPEDWKRLMERNDLDTVVNSGPLDIHAPSMIACMNKGIIGATELPACGGVSEAWELIEAYHRTDVPFMMLENYIYRRFEQMILNMVSQDVFGEVSHCTVSYMNESPHIMWDQDGNLLWRGRERALRNGSQYSTHAVGPAGKWLDINRGDRFEYMVSMGGRSVGLNHHARRSLGPDHPFSHKSWPLNDVNTTLIKTFKGISVTVIYDAILPRPGEFVHRIQGTKGISSGTLNAFHLQDRSPFKRWEDAEVYYDEYDHPNWKKHGSEARHHGHGGADYIMMLDFIDNVRKGSEADLSVDPYDAVTWSTLNDLTEMSVNNKSRPIDCPDFTVGRWQHRKPQPVRAI